MEIYNPILPGFHPDPSVVQVGDDYYLATSTFEWWPGVEIYHSRDLARWQPVGSAVRETLQANLRGNCNSGGIWAPHLSYSEGKFWLAYTDVKTISPFKDTLNYVITTSDIRGPWSEPVFVTASGFDPSFFHDEDGRHYFLNMLFDYRPGRQRFAGTVIQEFDPQTMRLVGERRHFYKGNALGTCEGPQILKKDGFYYLLCAAGGTGYSHAATVARCKNLQGPFEESPFFPLLTSADVPDAPLQKSGHACFLRHKGEWYIVHLCARPLSVRGNCVLGRETALQKIEWVDGWPRLCGGGCHPRTVVQVEGAAGVPTADHSERVDFAVCRELPLSFKTLRGPLAPEQYSLDARKGYLRLYGRQSLASLHSQTLLARRWQAFDFTVETWMEFSPENFQQMAGLVLFYDTEHWFYACQTFGEEQGGPVLLALAAEAGQLRTLSPAVPWPAGQPVVLRAQVTAGTARFSFGSPGAGFCPLGGEFDVQPLSDDSIMANSGRMAFTGAMAGICAQDMDRHTSCADFRYFHYLEGAGQNTTQLVTP